MAAWERVKIYQTCSHRVQEDKPLIEGSCGNAKLEGDVIMKKRFPPSSTTVLFLLAAPAFIGALLPGGIARGAAAPPPALFNLPLNQIPVPEPPNLFDFVKSKTAAIKLGKALFWDMQAGSDGIQACASCHFSAGADNRMKNSVNPGTRAGDSTFQVRGPNGTLQPEDFPFHKRQNPDFQVSPVLRDANDVVGSQGVKLRNFTGITPGSAIDNGTPLADPLFQVAGVNMRRVTARNTPTNINAVFNFSNFWDGRAHFIFNGENPFGPLDPNAGVWFNENGTLAKRRVTIEMASLASQATGPPLDDIEMSFRGRTFPQLGRKMLALTPLGQQVVHPNDGALGPLSRALQQPDGKLTGDKGLKTNYAQMIKDAFVNNLWDSTELVPGGFNQMEANFSLFWGLAIQLYEATLVSDQTPLDRFLGGNQDALTPQQQDGMNIFFGTGKCDVCHGGIEFTNSTAGAAMFVTNADNAIFEQATTASGKQFVYDDAFNNTAVRPIAEDVGRGGTAPFTNPFTGQPLPLSFTRLAKLQASGALPFATPILPATLPATFPAGTDGFFKIPGLRNVELTAPYMHNGGMLTLDEVVDFYTRGGDFPGTNADSLDVNITQIGTLQNAPDKQAALVAFMKSLTDERVRNHAAPFDHPELFIPNGAPEMLIRIPARDADGNTAPSQAFTIDPVAAQTNQTSLALSGTKEVGVAIQVKVNNNPAVTADAPTANTWNATIGGLVAGVNNIMISGTDVTGVQTLELMALTLDAVPAALTVTVVNGPIRGDDYVLSGAVEAGIIPVVTAASPDTIVGPVTVSGTAWSAHLSMLAVGPNDITVTAADRAGNVTSTSVSIVKLGDGIFNGTLVPDISDALKALRIAVGIITPTADELLHGDVAPLGAPDGVIDLADVLLIMRNVVGTINLSN